MRAISLWQPWASAIPLGLKKIETRHWSTDYRGRLAIHAAKRWGPDERSFASQDSRLPHGLPFGAIVATAMLVNVRTTDALLTEGLVTPDDARYGNFDPGRFGWLLEEIVALREPIPLKGRQGFFDVPDELLPDYALQRVMVIEPQQGSLLVEQD